MLIYEKYLSSIKDKIIYKESGMKVFKREKMFDKRGFEWIITVFEKK